MLMPNFSMVKGDHFHRAVLAIHSTKKRFAEQIHSFSLASHRLCTRERYRCPSVPHSTAGSGITTGTEGASAAAGEMQDHRGLSAPFPSRATSVLLSKVIGPTEEKNN